MRVCMHAFSVTCCSLNLLSIPPTRTQDSICCLHLLLAFAACICCLQHKAARILIAQDARKAPDHTVYAPWQAHKGEVTCLHYNPEFPSKLMSGGAYPDDTIKIWDRWTRGYPLCNVNKSQGSLHSCLYVAKEPHKRVLLRKRSGLLESHASCWLPPHMSSCV